MHSVINALVYLRFTLIRNAIVTRIQRLKQPKYLFGAIAGGFYFYWVFYRQFSGRTFGQSAVASNGSATLTEIYASPFATGGALLFMVFILLYWVWPRARAALTFSEAEIAFLFPAPIPRHTLIHYRMINLMLGLLFTALIFSLFSRGAMLFPGTMAMRFIGWWMVLLTLGLHSIASSFVITRLLDRGITSLRRQWVVAATTIAVVVSFGWWASRSIPSPTPADLVDIDALRGYAVNLFGTAPLSWLLFPARLVIAPMFARSWMQFITALLPAILVVAVHYYWVLRSEVSFEEASIIKAEKRAAKIASIRAGKTRVGSSAPTARKPPFDINFIRRPEVAFLWKNLLATASYLRLKTAMIACVMIIFASQWIKQGDHEVIRGIVLAIGGVFSGYVLFLGPLIARQDLRSDLPNTDILKSYPLRGWQVVLGEILTPVVVLSFIFWLLLLAGSLCLHTESLKWMTPGIHWSATMVIAITAPLLCTIQILVLNAGAILFPSWVQLGQGNPGGIEVMGQRILFIAGLMLIIVFSLLPAALFAVLIFLLTKWLLGIVMATTLAAITVIAILIVEIVFGLEWLGQKFEQFDLSAELRS
ncbi:MAG: putative ABC exporter domain-containing protein [Steroidobacter sp.]